jgi:hypothetical protein
MSSIESPTAMTSSAPNPRACMCAATARALDADRGTRWYARAEASPAPCSNPLSTNRHPSNPSSMSSSSASAAETSRPKYSREDSRPRCHGSYCSRRPEYRDSSNSFAPESSPDSDSHSTSPSSTIPQPASKM